MPFSYHASLSRPSASDGFRGITLTPKLGVWPTHAETERQDAICDGSGKEVDEDRRDCVPNFYKACLFIYLFVKHK